jgi:hypothetical protein
MRNTLIHFVLRFYDISLAGFYTLIVIYVAGLSARQSIVLALLFTGLAHGIIRSANKSTPCLRPYHVRIWPDLAGILNDYQLVRTVEEWNQVREAVDRTPATLSCIWRYGIGFTVLSESDDGERGLIYSNSHNSFVSEVRFEEFVSPFQCGRFDRLPGLLDYETVSVFIRPGRRFHGYELGISVPRRWWETVRESCPIPDREQEAARSGYIDFVEHGAGYVDLILAAVSYQEFDLYSESGERKDVHKKIAARDEHRKRQGWEVQKEPLFISLNPSDTIKHRYFLVEHHSV